MNKYPVNDLYYTIQGEGAQTGIPAVFLRLHGCDVGCPFCDTRETWDMNPSDEVPTLPQAMVLRHAYVWQTAEEIATQIEIDYPSAPWVVVTGGEPALYPLAELVTSLQKIGKKVAIETSGTAAGHVDAHFDWVTVSPKINMPGKKPVLAEAVVVADEIKHVVGKKSDVDVLDAFLDAYPLPYDVIVCLQPISQSERATELCVATAKERGWRLSIQTHKYLNLP